MKNVLSIAPYRFLPASSGGQRAIFYLYQHLSGYVNLTCVSTRSNDITPGPGFEVIPIFSASFLRYLNPAYFFAIRRIIKKRKIDTVLMEHPYMGIFGWLLQLFCKRRLVIRSHNIEALRFKELGKWWWKILWHYERWVHQQADFSFFITQEDRLYAARHYGIPLEKSSVITYGMESRSPVDTAQKRKITADFKKKWGVPENKTLLLFNGIFGYAPNDQALTLLIDQILPALVISEAEIFLIVCGRHIPAAYEGRRTDHLQVLGFVPDIEAVYWATEIFLNPIWLGGGIKTKLVEALAYGASAVSFESGAIGIPRDLLDGKLKVVGDERVNEFAYAIIQQKNTSALPTPDGFIQHFNWDHIAATAASSL